MKTVYIVVYEEKENGYTDIVKAFDSEKKAKDYISIQPDILKEYWRIEKMVVE